MFDVGDLVVCVNDKAYDNDICQFLPIVRGQTYRVVDVQWLDNNWAVFLDGVKAYSYDESCGFDAPRFRKIDAPDTEVSRLIRACKPVREGQPA